MPRTGARGAALSGGGPEDTSFVKFRGVSVRCLDELRLGLLDGTIAGGLRLYCLNPGWHHKSELWYDGPVALERIAGEVLHCTVPSIGAIEVNQDDVSHELSREEWGLQDIYNFVLPEMMISTTEVYLDLLADGQVGERFQGAFVCTSIRSEFGPFVLSLLSECAARGVAPEGQFVWLEGFCTQPHWLSNPGWRNERDQLLEHDLRAAIAEFEDFWYYLDTWDGPDVHKWSCSSWELSSRIDSGQPMRTLFNPGELARFLVTVQRPHIDQAVTEVAGENGFYHYVEDRAPIASAVAAIGDEDWAAVIKNTTLYLAKEFVSFLQLANAHVVSSELEGVDWSEFELRVGKDIFQTTASWYVALHGSRDDLVTFIGSIDMTTTWFIYDRGWVEEANSAFKRLVETGNFTPFELAGVYSGLAVSSAAFGDRASAIHTFDALAALEEARTGTRDHEDVAKVEFSIAFMLQDDDLQRSAELFSHAAHVFEVTHGSRDHPLAARAREELERVRSRLVPSPG